MRHVRIVPEYRKMDIDHMKEVEKKEYHPKIDFADLDKKKCLHVSRKE